MLKTFRVDLKACLGLTLPKYASGHLINSVSTSISSGVGILVLVLVLDIGVVLWAIALPPLRLPSQFVSFYAY